jgi:DNA-binding NarL/FixJ family response regulator
MSTFRILVADDHPIFPFGLCSLLGSREGWEVCGEAADGRDAAAVRGDAGPDLAVFEVKKEIPG